jgi:hypothetical protein
MCGLEDCLRVPVVHDYNQRTAVKISYARIAPAKGFK